MAVDFALYARALGWPPEFIGGVIGAGLLFAGLATALAGPLSDRWGRKPFLLFYQALSLLTAIVALGTARRWVLAVLVALAGYGRGAAGAPALFGAVEQAWLAGAVPRERLAPVFSINTALGFFGNAAGALLGALPEVWQGWLPGALAYRPLFAFAGLSAAASLWLLAGTEDSSATHAARPPPSPRIETRGENRLLLALSGLNALNGFGIGLVGPLITWWFAARYGVGPRAIGSAIGVILVLAGVCSLLAGRIGMRFGAVRTVVAMRGIGLALLLALPFMPTYGLAILVYGARTILNRGSAGQRQAVILGAVRRSRQGLAAAVSSVSTQLPRALGPLVAGALFGAGMFTGPFLIAAAFQAGYLVLYPVLFRRHDLGGR